MTRLIFIGCTTIHTGRKKKDKVLYIEKCAPSENRLAHTYMFYAVQCSVALPQSRLLVELCELTVRAEHIGNLVLVHLLHEVACRSAILTWVELSWFVVEYLTNSSSEGKT